MGLKTRIALLAGIVVVVAAGVWYFESPVWTLSRMKDAAEANDPQALNAFIDYPALRESLKEEVSAKLMNDTQDDRSLLSGLKFAVGSAMVGPAVDALVTPAGMRAALRAKRADETARGTGPAAAIKLPDDPMIRHRGLSEFILTAKNQRGNAMVFRRDGLAWKLSGIELSSDRLQE